MQPYPVIPSLESLAPTGTRRKRAWLWLGIGAGAAFLVLGIVYSRTRPPENQGGHFPDLAEWFDRAHRIRPAEQVISVEGIGMLLPPAVSPSPQFSPNWLEQNFTHYVADDAFVWAVPIHRYPSHGKILAGTKVISSGKQVRQFTLVCTVTKDARAINLFMETSFLRERSKGPPAIRDD